MDYLFELMDIPIAYYGVALFIFGVAYGAYSKVRQGKRAKALAFGAFFSYVFLVLASTLFVRRVTAQATYTFKMFWSFYDYWTGADPKLLPEIILNVVMFVPIGFLMPCWLKDFRYRKTAGISLALTVFIEVTQLVAHRGLFEFDDIIHNFLGALIGILLFIFFLEKNRLWSRRMFFFIVGYTAAYVAVVGSLYLIWEKESDDALALLQEETRMENTANENAEDTSDEDAAEEEKEPYVSPIDFESLWQKNADIIGWVTVPGTSVDYPILQSNEEMAEDFYLNHNLDGSAGYPGCIYIQKTNASDFSDTVTVVYGHNMKNGSMFAGLHKFENADFWEEHPEFTVYTPEAEYTYTIYVCRDYDDRLILDNYNYFKTRENLMTSLSDLTKVVYKEQLALLNPDLSVGEKDKLVILSTCTDESTNRWLVVGVLQQ